MIIDFKQAGGSLHKDGTITFWASSLRLGRGQDFSRIFDDAIDVGVFVRSHKTGKLAVYSVESTDEKDGDIRAWTLTPVRPSASMYHKREVSNWDRYKDTKVVIFNT